MSVRLTGVVITAIVFVSATLAFERSASLGTVAKSGAFAIVIGVSVAWELPTRLLVWFRALRASRRRPESGPPEGIDSRAPRRSGGVSEEPRRSH